MLPKIFLLFSITSSVMAEGKDDPAQADTPQSPETGSQLIPGEFYTKLWLYPREYPNTPQEMNIAHPETIQASNLDPSRNNIMIMPDAVDGLLSGWVTNMCSDLVEKVNVNCFAVSWLYTGLKVVNLLTVDDIRTVGTQVRHYVDIIQSMSPNPPSFWLMGKGLGAHVAGVAGNGQGEIDRITAFNPDREYAQATPLSDRLDKSDAKLVDVIYTTGAGSGMNVDIGHLEFIVNGGEHMPGCEATSDNPGQGDQSTCDDMRSIMYYRESISNPDGFKGYSAPSYDAFQQGAGFPCPGIGCPTMGYNAASYPGITSDTQRFYLNTGAEKPFSCERYKFIFEYFGAIPITGLLSLSLKGSNGESEDHTLSRGENTHGATLINYSEIASLIAVPFQPVLYWIGDTSAQLGPTMLTLQSGKDASISSFCFDDPVLPGGSQVPIPCA